MPKMSRTDATTHMDVPGFGDAYEKEMGGWTVTIERSLTDMDMTPVFKGAPDDQCQAHHLGYILSGKMGVRRGDGVEEIFEAGDAFVIEPGHIPIMFPGCEYVSFTPTEDAREQAAVMMPNMMKLAAEQGIELPGQMGQSG
jgi:hypothetical protein